MAVLTGVAAWLGFAWWLDAVFRRREADRASRGPPAAGERHGTAGAGRLRSASGGGPEPSAELPAPIAFHRREDEPSDEELVARVRSQVDIPPSVEVTAVEGAVVLFGRVPRFAFAALLSRVARVQGVVDVEDRLTLVDDLDASDHP